MTPGPGPREVLPAPRVLSGREHPLRGLGAAARVPAEDRQRGGHVPVRRAPRRDGGLAGRAHGRAPQLHHQGQPGLQLPLRLQGALLRGSPCPAGLCSRVAPAWLPRGSRVAL
eukprot:bmy_13892T0